MHAGSRAALPRATTGRLVLYQIQVDLMCFCPWGQDWIKPALSFLKNGWKSWPLMEFKVKGSWVWMFFYSIYGRNNDSVACFVLTDFTKKGKEPMLSMYRRRWRNILIFIDERLMTQLRTHFFFFHLILLNWWWRIVTQSSLWFVWSWFKRL